MTNILDAKTPWDLVFLNPKDFAYREMSPEELRHIFTICDALWLHNGDPAAPHAKLTSGKCSDGFVDTLRVLRYSFLCDVFGFLLLKKLADWAVTNTPNGRMSFEWVVGSDHAGAALSHSVAIHANCQHDFTEKGSDKTQLWKRFQVKPGQAVLQVEELITTTGTLAAVRKGIRDAHEYPVEFAPAVLTLIHRSPTYEFEDAPILHLAHFDIQTWEPDQCPLCAAGSEPLRPKENWAEITGG